MSTILRLDMTGAWPSAREGKALIDLRMVASTPPYTEIQSVMRLPCVSWLARQAYIVGSAVQFGLVRQMQALAPPDMAIEIFFDEAAALRWLEA